MTPLVTVAIPTFDRPVLLRRSLEAVAAQDYENLEVLVADNASPKSETSVVVEGIRPRIPQIALFRHEESLGPIGNFLFLLDRAAGQYFMWLADDDEISSNYVSSLVEMLESQPDASAAAGRWILMRDSNVGGSMATSSFPQRSKVVRALRYIWRSDDAFFYALHRTSILRQASFRGFWWPNRGVATNWAYVYLLDVVLRGRVLLAPDPSVQFINHDYTAKAYATSGNRMSRALAFVSRRINVHVLFWEKCVRHLSPAVLALVVPTSLLSLAVEAISLITARAVGRR